MPCPPHWGNSPAWSVYTSRPISWATPSPPELGQLSELITLDLSANQLSGPIPVELDQIPRLKMLDLRDNPLTGCLPPAWRQDNYPIVRADPGEETYCAE